MLNHDDTYTKPVVPVNKCDKASHSQLFYEIALSIGNHLELTNMLNDCLHQYLDKLNCATTIIYKQHQDNLTAHTFNTVYALPYVVIEKGEYANALNVIPDNVSPDEIKNFILTLPFSKKISKQQFLYIFQLPHYGLLVLIRKQQPFPKEYMNKLEQLNIKLAQACIACEKNSALEESENRYKELTEMLPEMICETDLLGNLTYANKYAIEKMGYTANDIINGFNVMNLFIESERKKAAYFFKKTIEQQKPHPREYTVQRKDGSLFTGIVYTNPIFTAGKITGVRGVMIDITEQKRYEKQLETNLRQQEILSEIALGVNNSINFEATINNILEKTGSHLNVSRAYVFENTPDGQYTSNTFEWCNSDITPQISELQNIPYTSIPSWKKLLTQQGRVISENIYKLPPDIVKILAPQQLKSIVVYPLWVKSRFFGFIGFDECLREISWEKSELELLRTISGIIANAFERQQSVISLQESEATNRAIVASLPDMLFHFNRQGKLLNFNFLQSNITIFNEVVIHKNIHRIFPKTLATKLFKSIEICLIKEQYNFEFDLLLEKQHAYFEARLSKINNTEIIVLIRDITQEREHKTELQKAMVKAEKANLAKSEFLANMSHEIRTPLNAIMGFSEALYHSSSDPEHKHMSKAIINSGKILLSLINDILDLSKIEAGMLNLTRHPVNLKSLLNEIEQLFTQKAISKNLAFDIHVPDNIPEILYLDEIRIRQVLLNIAGNAIKFTNQGSVSIKCNTQNRTKNKLSLKISVSDTGIGIPVDQQENIFNAFVQQSGQSNRNYEGTGLGLSISKKLIEKMHGSISINSAPGQGAEFCITIPDIKFDDTIPKYLPVDERQHDEIIFKPAKVLVVDDVKINIITLQYLLKNTAIEFQEAANAEIALEIVKLNPPDLIIMDLRMPEINGYITTQKITAQRKNNSIPVIAYTASIFEIEKAKSSGLFNDYLIKPVTKHKLISVLIKFLAYEKTNHKPLSDASQTASLPQHFNTLRNKLNTELLDNWNNINNTLIISRIEAFTEALRKLEKKHPYKPLNDYIASLSNSIQFFDLENLKTTLAHYPQLVSEFNALNKNKNK